MRQDLQQAYDRPDLTVRAFNPKLMKLMNLLKNGTFGQLQAWLYSTEFQKRGLSHAHILLSLTKEHTITPEAIDSVASAEISKRG